MFQAVTIKDIAEALSVSPSTVSRALRDSHEVSAATKKLITDYAKKINYRSNPVAQSLKTRRSFSIGVQVADVANSFFSQAINGIESVAYDKGYHVIITQSHDIYQREVINIEHLASRSIDGLLISMSSQTTNYNHISDLHNRGLPMVFFDRIIDDVETFKVTTDNFKSVFEATNTLLEKGIRSIGFLGNAPQLSITTSRLNGYIEALKTHHIDLNPILIKYCTDGGRNKEEVKLAIIELLNHNVDALLIASDQISTEAVRVLNTLNQETNVILVGFSNSEVIDLWSPKIAYIRQNAFEMGRIAAQKLISIIESKYPIYDFDTTLLDTDFFPN